MDLLTDLPRERKVQTPLPDPEEVERRLLLETIDEIAGLDPVIIEVDAIENEINDQDEPIFDVIERMKANFKGFTGFKDKIVEDPSLQRDCIEDVSNFPGPSSISMPEVIPADLDLNNLNREDAFGEATAEDIADAGLFAGPLGRPLYEGLKNRETMADISRRAAQSMTPLNQEMPEIFINDFPQLPNPRRTTLGVPVPQVELTDHSLLNELPAAYPDVFVEDGPPQPQAAVIDQTVSPPRDSKRMSRREYFEDAVNVIEGKMMGKPTKRRRRRRLRRSPSLEDLEFLELNGLLVRHNRKQKVTRASTPKIQPSITMDIFENLEDYESDEIFDDEVEEIQMETEQEIRSVLPPLLEDELFVVPETLQHQPMTPTAEVLLIPKSNNSESFVPKRRRVDRLETDELREIIGFDDNLAPPLPAPRQLTAQLETPLAAFKPPKVSTVRGDGIQKITLDDIEFGRLRNVSASNLQGNHSLDAGTIASYLGRSKSAIGDAVATAHGAAGASSNAHRQPDDSLELRRYVKDGENWIAYEGHGGRIEHYTEYNLEVRIRRLSNLIHLFVFFHRPSLCTFKSAFWCANAIAGS